MDKGIYSQLKPAFHGRALDSLRARRVAAPVHLQLVLSDLCNQDCGFCAYRMSGGLSTELFGTAETHNPNRQLDGDLARRVLSDFAEAGGRAVQFTGGGEPTLHRKFAPILEHAQSLGLDTALVTNGVRLESIKDEPLARLKWARISVDAGTEESYGRIRRVTAAHWRKAWTSIARLAELGTRVGVGFVVTRDNFAELTQLVDHAADAKADNVRVGAVFSTGGNGFYAGLDYQIAVARKAARARAAERGIKLLDLFDRRMGDLAAGAPKREFCGYQYLTAYIGGDGAIYRCCNTAYTRAGKVWQLDAEHSFAGYLEQLAPDGFDARNCRHCQFLGQNEQIAELIDEVPQDVNFV